MSGDFKATPCARLFFGISWKGLVRKSTIWALLIFLHSRTFPKKTPPMYSQMNCLIESEYIRELSLQKIISPMYSQMNCLIENEYMRELSLQKKITYAFPNELPNWKRIHKGTFLQKKNHLCIPTWIAYLKTNTKGKKRKKRGKKVGVLYYGGVLLLWTGSWRTLLRGGLLTPCEH